MPNVVIWFNVGQGKEDEEVNFATGKEAWNELMCSKIKMSFVFPTSSIRYIEHMSRGLLKMRAIQSTLRMFVNKTMGSKGQT